MVNLDRFFEGLKETGRVRGAFCCRVHRCRLSRVPEGLRGGPTRRQWTSQREKGEAGGTSQSGGRRANVRRVGCL